MVNHFLEFVEPLITERLDKVFIENKDYQYLVEKETLCFEELKKTLSKEQQAKLDDYFNATSITAIACEKIAYQYGMKDLIELLGGLMFDRKI